jgi:hypothetical protein
MNKMTRAGARGLTSTIDRIASTFQKYPEVLGMDAKIAMDFAYRCDLVSDAIEGKAAANFPADSIGDSAGVLEGDGDEPYMSHIDGNESSELSEVEAKMASLLAEAEQFLGLDKEAADSVTVQGYDQFTAQIRQLEELTTKAQELDAQIQAAVGPLLKEKAGLDKNLKKVHETIKKEYKDNLSAIGNVTIERKGALVEARAMLKVAQVKRTQNQVQAELMAAITEQYGAEVAEFIKTTEDALRDTKKSMRVAFQGFELEQRASKTASSKEAGLADMLARFQNFLLKGWSKMVQVVSNAARLVAGAGSSVGKVHNEFVSVMGDIQDGKIASEAAPVFNLFA